MTISVTLHYEQKMAAIKALCGDFNVGVKMRGPADWYVESSAEIGGDGMLTGKTQSASTPEAAIEEWWAQYAFCPSDRYVVARDRRVRWNGFMWEDVKV